MSELVRQSRQLPRLSRQQLQQTFTDGLDAHVKVDAIWGVTRRATKLLFEVETERRQLVGDDNALAQTSAQWMATACAKTTQVIDGMYGGGYFG